MNRYTLTASFCLIFAAGSLRSQTNSFTSSFKPFKDIAPGVDFFAANRNEIVPFEKAVIEARKRLATFLGSEMSRGAIVICSTAAQRDTVTEIRLLRMGYKWALIQMTPEATVQQQLAQMKARMGEIPPQVLERLSTPEMRASQAARMVTNTVQRMCYSILTTTMAPEKEFRPSRFDDVGRSPLADWVDIGLVSYAIGEPSNLRILQDRMEEAFPLEDVLSMSRPFIAPESGGSGGGGGNVVIRMGGAPAGGAARPPNTGGMPGGGSGGSRGAGGGRNMPKEQLDRMFFDAQASTFFAYLVEKQGIDKLRALVKANQEGKVARDMVASPEMLGSDMDKIEQDWQAWVKVQKAQDPGNIRVITAPDRPSGPPIQF